MKQEYSYLEEGSSKKKWLWRANKMDGPGQGSTVLLLFFYVSGSSLHAWRLSWVTTYNVFMNCCSCTSSIYIVLVVTECKRRASRLEHGSKGRIFIIMIPPTCQSSSWCCFDVQGVDVSITSKFVATQQKDYRLSSGCLGLMSAYLSCAGWLNLGQQISMLWLTLLTYLSSSLTLHVAAHIMLSLHSVSPR